MHFYNFADFCLMIADRTRSENYAEALRRAVRPDSIVLDIGAGTGFYSMLACQYGARKVYAVEPNPLINLGKDFAAQYGFQDRIEFIQDVSTVLELTEKADVLISDLRGTTPLAGPSVASVIDARKRLLKSDAVMIAQKDTMFFALAEATEIYETNISRYLEDHFGINISSAKRLLTNRILSPEMKDVRVVSAPRKFAELDYTTLEETSFGGKMEWTIEKSGVLHGLLTWFVSDLGYGLQVTNGPDNPDAIYGRHFIPFDEPLEVEQGERLEAVVTANYDGQSYIWSWQTALFSADSETPKKRFSQATSFANYIPPGEMLKQSEYFRPEPNENAEINLVFLQMLNGENLLGDIADALLEKFPDKFKNFDEALSSAANLAKSYSR